MATIISIIKADVQACTELHTAAHLKAYGEDLAHTLTAESSITDIDYATLFNMYLGAIHTVMLAKEPITPSEVSSTPVTNMSYQLTSCNDAFNDEFDTILDETYPDVVIAGITFTASQILRDCDPIAYRCAVVDFIDESEEEEEDYNA